MADDIEMRQRLQSAAAYRELCRGVRRSGRANLIFAGVMLFLAYAVWQGNNVIPIVLVILATAELFVGFFKWVWPSAEGVLLDGFVLLMFAGINFYRFFNAPQAQQQTWIALFSAYMLYEAVGRFKAYGQLRKLFADRPSAELMAWFDGLIDEIRAADPRSDELALDLPTRPHWKAKLFGNTAFFVALRGDVVWVAGAGDFELLREKTDRGTGRRKAMLRFFDRSFPEFEIADVSWDNYLKWMAGLAVAPRQ